MIQLLTTEESAPCSSCSGNGCRTCRGSGECATMLESWRCSICQHEGEGNLAGLEECPACGAADGIDDQREFATDDEPDWADIAEQIQADREADAAW